LTKLPISSVGWLPWLLAEVKFSSTLTSIWMHQESKTWRIFWHYTNGYPGETTLVDSMITV